MPCCAVCGPEDFPRLDLTNCSRCKCVSYCGRDHQKEDYENHKRVCRNVQKCRKKMNALVEKLPVVAFEELAGRFSSTPETSAIVCTKRDYMLMLTVTRSYKGVSLALEQGLECLRLCRVDHLAIRNAVPALMLQLGQRQQCYDFIKWWVTFDPHRTVDLTDLSVPMFTVKNALMTEPIPKGFFHPKTSVFHWAAFAYIKIELVFGVDLTLDMVQGEGGMINMILSTLNLSRSSSIEETRERMKSDLATATTQAFLANNHYWSSVLNVHSLSDEISPGVYVRGGPFEVQDAFAKDVAQRFAAKLASL